MNSLTEAYVNSFAPNAAAVKNGWGLVRKNQLQNLHISSDGTLIFGECKGSGKNPYFTSADFIKGDPVFRCSCPSRQFPCKHSLGLLYAYINGAPFTEASIPEDIIAKRSKASEREEKKKEQQKAPRKVNKSALSKKLHTQLEGLSLLEKQINQLLLAGLASIDPKKLKQLDETARLLGNHYLKEAQNELRAFILLWKKEQPEERLYQLAYERLLVLHALCKKGRQHLEKRLEDENLLPDTATSIEEWLGHTWQLTELKEYGQVKQNVRLVQLSFASHRNEARGEYVDQGIWLDLGSGELVYTKNYRPFKALKYIKEEDSVMEILSTSQLYIYPGEGNRRVRWEEYTLEGKADFSKVRGYAKESVTEVLKEVRNILRLPLADKQPAVLISFSRIGKVEGEWQLEDMNGVRLSLVDSPEDERPTLPLLGLLPDRDLKNQAILVHFYHDQSTGMLGAKPLSIITENRLIRLLG
ncbi:hypothetical protein A8F94_12530 [Bacillus sp. FJAT-27225]|uniref:SWIM zinc finger family protein n=1 Tax=Bacillus sp. FJAT-27225 TaxID=1743144 RepID=UPI00080C2285|nr:SWIM zinc finger family protein [Bacillus sp. FJAT-27225]OCA85695.1 hypothetical protein A8F94_12530 [Bacillus sp. FJAT-27225]